MSVRIIADSTCDLSPELLERYHIAIAPLYVKLGDKLYRDDASLTADQIFDYVKETGVLPSTIGISVGDWTEHFKKARADGDDVVCVTISSAMSCTYESAVIAADEVGHVWPVDSRNLSTGIGHVAVNAAIFAQQGLSAPEIVERLNDMIPKVRSSFILDTLDYMKKGGRCSSVAVLGANLLKIKPTILVENGTMKVGQKFRGTLEKVLENYVDSQLQGRDDIRTDRIFITSPYIDPKLVEIVRKRIQKHLHFDEILPTKAGGTIASHCGPNTLGILYVVK